MPTVDGASLDRDAMGGVLDLPVLLDDSRRGDRRVAYLNPESAARAGRPLEALTPSGIWSALRELPVGDGLIVDPDGPEALDFAPGEIDPILGGSRQASSILSWRRRADLGSRWVLFHKNAEGRPLAPVQNEFGQRFAFAWTDQQAATAALQPGNSLVQVPLVIALRGNPGVTVLLDAGAPEQVVIDEPLSAEIIAAADYFPRDYLATVATLVPREEAKYVIAARHIVSGVRSLGLPVRSAKVVGYRLERARAQVIVVLDTDGGAAWDAALGAIGRMVPRGVPSPDAVLRRGDISETFSPMIDAAPERANE
jgi:hypothetical protein